MPASPPTKYTPSRIKKMKKYLTSWAKGGDVIPTVEAFSNFIEISVSTINEWDKHEDKLEISETLEKIRKDQKTILMNKGLLSEFNSNITKLLLHNHGLSDKSENKLTGDNDNPIGITIKVVDAKS